MKLTRVIIADDHSIIRDGLKALLKEEKNISGNEKKQREVSEQRARAAIQQAEELVGKAALAEQLRSENNSIIKKNSELEEIVEKEKRGSKELQVNFEKSATEIVELKAIIEHSNDRSRARHQQQLDLLQQQLLQEQEKNLSQQKEMERVKGSLKEALSQHQVGKSSELSTGKNSKVLERKLKNNDKIVEELKSEVLTQKTEISRMEDKLKESKKTYAKIFTEKCDLESQCKHLQHELQLSKGKLELALTPTVYSQPKPVSEQKNS